MLGKDLSEALDGIGDEKLTAAMKVYEKKRQKRSLWLRVGAAAAALVILLTTALWPRQTTDGQIFTAPGILKVYAYDMTGGTGISKPECMELEQGVEMPYEYGWSVAVSWQPGLPLKFSMPEDEFEGAQITFEVTTDGGEFFRKPGGRNGAYYFGPAYLGRQFTLENNQTIYWWNMITDLEIWTEEYDEEKIRAEIKANQAGKTTGYTFPEVTPFLAGKAYMDIIIRADGHIVGCMTVMIYAEDLSFPIGSDEYMGCRYYAKLLGSIYCPKQNGEYQNVSREQMMERMESWK